MRLETTWCLAKYTNQDDYAHLHTCKHEHRHQDRRFHHFVQTYMYRPEKAVMPKCARQLVWHDGGILEASTTVESWTPSLVLLRIEPPGPQPHDPQHPWQPFNVEGFGGFLMGDQPEKLHPSNSLAAGAHGPRLGYVLRLRKSFRPSAALGCLA